MVRLLTAFLLLASPLVAQVPTPYGGGGSPFAGSGGGSGGGGGDGFGPHIATKAVDMGGYSINNSSSVRATGEISGTTGSFTVIKVSTIQAQSPLAIIADSFSLTGTTVTHNSFIFVSTGPFGTARILKMTGTHCETADGCGLSFAPAPTSRAFRTATVTGFPTGTDFTVEGWFKSTTTDGELFSFSNTGFTQYVRMFITGGNVRVDIAPGSFDTGDTFPLDGNYHHVAMSRSGTSLKVFLDGAEIGSTSSGDSLPSITNRVEIGAFNNANNLTGVADEVRVSSTARYTTSFSTGSVLRFATDVNTSALYHTDEGHPIGGFDVLQDASGNVNTLTIEGSPFPTFVGGNTGSGPGAPVVVPTTGPIVNMMSYSKHEWEIGNSGDTLGEIKGSSIAIESSLYVGAEIGSVFLEATSGTIHGLNITQNLQLPTSNISGGGSGSGADADKLDGLDSTAFVTTATFNSSTETVSGFNANSSLVSGTTMQSLVPGYVARLTRIDLRVNVAGAAGTGNTVVCGDGTNSISVTASTAAVSGDLFTGVGNALIAADAMVDCRMDSDAATKPFLGFVLHYVRQ